MNIMCQTCRLAVPRILQVRRPKFTKMTVTTAAEFDERTTNSNIAFNMKSWQIDDYKGIQGLKCNENTEIPVLRSPLDILVEVHAASVNPFDVVFIDGYGSRTLGLLRGIDQGVIPRARMEFALIPGRDFSGIIKDVGLCVKEFKSGDEVFGIVNVAKPGSHAEYVISSSLLLAKKPKGLSHVEAAAIGYAGLTAWSALRWFGGVQPQNAKGMRALVLGGSGGVGTIAIQLLKSWGMQVTTTASSNAIELVCSLGANIAIDYTQPNCEDELKELEGFDLILNCTKNLSSTYGMELLKTWRNAKYVHLMPPLLSNINALGWPFGFLASAADFGFDSIKGLQNGRSYRWAYVLPCKTGLEALADLARMGMIQPVVEKVFPFEQTPQAYEKVKAGHARGKTVIEIKRSHKAAPADHENQDRISI